jgi:thiol:disulfide interchange protein DsbD
MGFTFSQPVMVAFLLFTVFAIGVATPYMMLSFFPQLINKMPPPGAWMETFKHIMAFPMLAATLFFLNAFGGVAGVSGMVWMMAGMLVIAAGLWVYGKWCAPAKKASTRHRGLAVAVILALIGFYISYGASKYRGSSEAADTGGLVWEEWSPELVRDLRAEGRMMFVDFTASW